jgi:hypothetical protein
LAIVALLATPCSSWAQTTAILPADSKPGDRLTVRTTAGATLKGRLAADSAGTLVLTSSSGEHRISHADVERVNRYRNRILFGPLIGFAGGVAAGIPLKELADNETGGGTSDLIKMIALGVGVGTVIDLFTRSNRTIYRKGGSPPRGLAIQPRKGGARVGWTVGW